MLVQTQCCCQFATYGLDQTKSIVCVFCVTSRTGTGFTVPNPTLPTYRSARRGQCCLSPFFFPDQAKHCFRMFEKTG